MNERRERGFATRSIHEGEEPNLLEGGFGDVSVPIHLSSTFARKRVEEPTGGFEYSRSGNPTRRALEQRLASLEGAQYGLAFSSGMGAETTVLLSLQQGETPLLSKENTTNWSTWTGLRHALVQGNSYLSIIATRG